MTGIFLSARFRGMHFAVRARVVAHYLGSMLLALGALTLVPLCVALASGHTAIALRYLAVVALFGACGWLGSRLTVTARVQVNEAMVVSVLIFVLSSLAMTLPLTGYGIPFLDAWFEAVSGITTTGLSTLGSVENRPAAFLFGRAWMQWIGGLGVLVLVLAMVSIPGAAARKLGFDDREAEDIAGGSRAHAKRILVVYGVLTAFGVVLLLVLGSRPLDAIVHAFAAVSTGGFSNYDGSLAAAGGWPLRAAVTLLCVLGAISFSWYYSGLYRSLPALLRDEGLITLLLLAGGCTLCVYLFMDPANGAWTTRLGHALVTSFSAQTTAGFSSVPPGELAAPSRLALIATMLIGGEIGSTSGGFKILRFLIVLRVLQLIIARASMPRHTRIDVRVGNSRVRGDELETVLAVLAAYALFIGASWTIFVAHGHDPLNSLFDVVSAVGTVGISAGIVAPDLAPALKIVLCVDMLVGRVEPIAAVVLLFPGTWLGKRRRAR